MSADIPDVSLRVLFDFEYQTKDGREISIHHGEKLFLLRKTNADWWQVIRNSSERPFYVPATYVTEKTDAFDKKMREERKAWVVDEIIADIPSRKQEDSSYINVWKENRNTYELKDSKISSYLRKHTLSKDKSEISQSRSQSRESYEEINTTTRRRRLVNGLSSSFDSDDSRSIDFVDVRTTVRQLSASPVNEEGTSTTTPVSIVDSTRLCAPVQTLKSSSSDTVLCLNNTNSLQGLPHTTTKPVCDDCFTKYHKSSNESIGDDCDIQPRPLSNPRYTAVKSKQLLDSSTECLDVKQLPIPKYRSNPRNAKLVHESSTDSVISDDYLLQRNTKLISTPKPRLPSSESSDADILDDHIYRRYPSNVHKLRTSYEKSIEQSLDKTKYEIDSTELRNIRLNNSASDSIICRTRLIREAPQQAPQRPRHLDIESCLYDNYRPRSKSAIAAELRTQPTRTKQLNAWLAQATSKQRSFNVERLIDVPTKNLRSGKSPSDFIRSNTWHTDYEEPLKPKLIPKVNGQVLFSSSLDVKPRIERTPSPRLGIKSLASPRIGIKRQSKVKQDSVELTEQPQTQQQQFQHHQKQEVQIQHQSRQYRRSPHTIDRGEGNYIGPPSTFLSNNAHKLKVHSRSLESINTGLHKRPMKRTISKSRDTSPRNINKISSLIDSRVLRTQENATINIINQSGIRITNATDKPDRIPQRSESSSDSTKHRNLNIEQKSKSSRESSRSASPRHLQPSRSAKNLNVRRESKESSASSRRSSPVNRSQNRKELTPSPSNLQTPLSASLEKLAQQIKFSPNITAQERIMMSKIADKLQHSCSFKSRFELDRIERRSRRGDNSILSSSWEKNIGPSEPRTKEKYLVRQHSHSQGSSPGPGRREDYTKLSAGRWDEELRCYRPTITKPISPIHSKRLTLQSSEEDGLRAASWDRKLSLEKPSIQISTTKSLEVDLNSQNRIENRQHLYAKAGFSAKASSWDSNLKHDDRKKNNFATSWDDNSQREDRRHHKPQKLNIYDKTSSWDSVDMQNKGRKLSKQFSDNWTLNFRSQGERLAKQTPTDSVWERHKGNEKMLAECGRAKTFSEIDKDHKKLDTNKKGRRSFSFRRKSKKLETSMSIRLPDSKASSIVGTRLSSQGSFGHSLVNRSYDSNRHDPTIGKLRHSPGGGGRSQPGKSSEESDSAKGPDSSFIPVPPGWTEKYDEAAEQMCYINDQSRVKWYASNDAEGRVYFYPENSEESAWSLPEVQKSQGSTTPAALSTELVGVENGDRAEGEEGPSAKENTASAHGGHRAIARNAKTRSLVLLPNKSPDEPTLGRNWPQLNASNMNVIREGSLWRTKFTEGGRRCRKNWAHCHAVLTQLHLLLYRDYKIYLQVGAPELSVELTGANIESGEHLSSRKNVFLITTLLGLQVLLQSDNQVVAQQWHLDIEKAIDNLPTNRQEGSPNVKHNRATRSKSVKVKGSTPSPGSIEDLTDDRQTKIRARLKKFFHRRPTREQLVTKGIYKDEPVFGRELAQVCAELDSSGTGLPGIGRVPPFVLRCIHAIESNPENLITDGLYRVSGNLSQVQTIRLQVDQNNLSAIDQEEDVHVLAGSLKLFFRELKQPLLPWEKFRHLLEDSSPKATKDRLNELSQILKTLPQPNLDTLRFLLKHLLKVVEHKQKNRMHIENLAIVWGPTLLAAEDLLRSTMAIDLMQQNQLLELLLRYFDQLF